MSLSSDPSTDDVHRPLNRFGQFSILLVAFVWIFEASAVAPILGQLAADFPGTSTLKLQLVLSAVFFTSIVFSVVAGALARRFDRRRLVIIGLLIYGVTGMLPAIATSIDQIIVLRLLTGVGVGLVLPMPNIIISERYSGGARERLLGLATAVANLANVVNSIIVGFILLLGWRSAFLSFAVVLVIMVVQIVGLPPSPPPRHLRTGLQPRLSVLALPARVWGLFLLMVANWTIFQTNILNMAFFVESERLGAPWTFGIAIALPAVGSIITGGLFARLYGLLGRYLAPASLVVFCLGFVLLASAHSLGALMAANITIGLGAGALVPLVLHRTTRTVDEEHREVALGVVSGGIHVGFIVAPFAQAALAAMAANPDVRLLFFVDAVVLAAAALAAAAVAATRGSTRITSARG